MYMTTIYMLSVCLQGFGCSSDWPHIWRLPSDDLSWWAHTAHGGRPGRVHQNQPQTPVRTSYLSTQLRWTLVWNMVWFECDICLFYCPCSLSLKWDNVRKELEGFAAMASSCKGGRITIEEFARFLKLPVNPALEELFALFDRVRNVHIKQFVILVFNQNQNNLAY